MYCTLMQYIFEEMYHGSVIIKQAAMGMVTELFLSSDY